MYELNRSVREWRIKSRHFAKSLEGVGSGSHDLGAKILHCCTSRFNSEADD